MSKPALAIAKREWSAYFNSPVAYVFIIFFLVVCQDVLPLSGCYFLVSDDYTANPIKMP